MDDGVGHHSDHRHRAARQGLYEGDQVVMLYGAANRDDRVFGNTAEDLHLDRDPNPHPAFGFGEHFCLGAALARLENA